MEKEISHENEFLKFAENVIAQNIINIDEKINNIIAGKNFLIDENPDQDDYIRQLVKDEKTYLGTITNRKTLSKGQDITLYDTDFAINGIPVTILTFSKSIWLTDTKTYKNRIHPINQYSLIFGTYSPEVNNFDNIFIYSFFFDKKGKFTEKRSINDNSTLSSSKFAHGDIELVMPALNFINEFLDNSKPVLEG